MKNKNHFKLDFIRNISFVITEKINIINTEYGSILREVLPKLNSTEKIVNFKLTDERLLSEIHLLFGDNCISDRTFKNIKLGDSSGSAFNVFIIIYSLNSIIDLINETIDRCNSPKGKLLKITFDNILDPLEG